MPYLITKRLKLIPFSLNLVQTILENKVALSDLIGVKVHTEWPQRDFEEILPLLYELFRQDPSLSDWVTILIHTADNTIIGDAGFKDKPNHAREIEIGYSVIPAYRQQGYAYEAAKALVKWAFKQDSVKLIKADCDIGNVASSYIKKNLVLKK